MSKTMGSTATLAHRWVVLAKDGTRVYEGIDFKAALQARREHDGELIREDLDCSP